ncbi:hypothetical protein ARMSODRAFT_1006956 [Armillaria solidipes]|uniref:Uncharacterized protein n=1 Tax=Armillaria solidipes TaxID=1076256 RepID=A0A2H3B5D8_9AGAR|nr:hypothetical protein ARMSODRAFT_1006956 [Armillaria solidipes]
MNYTPSELATTQGSFEQWAEAALVETVPFEEHHGNVPSECRKSIDVLKHLELPKVLKERLVSARDDNNEEAMIRYFARDLLNKFEVSFTLDTDDYSLKHEWRKLATGHENLIFALTAPHPSINEDTARHGVDTLLHQVVRVAGEKQKSRSVRYQHEVSTAMSKTYTKVPFHVSHELECDGQATYRLRATSRLAIRKFGTQNGISTEVTSAVHLSPNCDDLCMVVVEYEKSDPTAAVQKLLMDFAAILRHRRLIGFGLEYLMGIVGSYKGSNFYDLTFYLGTLTDEGYVRHWCIDTLNIASPARLLRSYVWMINGLSTFITYAKTWTFGSTTPHNLPELLWRADYSNHEQFGHTKGSGGSVYSAKDSRKRKRKRRRTGDSQGHPGAGNGTRMDVSGSGVESGEESISGQRMVTLVDENGISYKVPHYTPSELARCVDEESDRTVVEAREWMRAQQGEISSHEKTQRYLDSMRQ